MKKINIEGKIESYWPAELNGSSYQGEIDISYKELVAAFGKEDSSGDDYKVQAEWFIETPAGLATIYDYKQGKKYNGNEEGIPKSQVRDWHIGGSTKEVVSWIYTALKLI